MVYNFLEKSLPGKTTTATKQFESHYVVYVS